MGDTIRDFEDKYNEYLYFCYKFGETPLRITEDWREHKNEIEKQYFENKNN